MAQVVDVTQFSIVDSGEYFTINGVKLPYDGPVAAVQVAKKPFNGGSYCTPREWQEFRRLTGWSSGSLPLRVATIASVYEHRTLSGAEEIKRLLVGENTTDTEIELTPTGPDIVIHDPRTSLERRLETNLVGHWQEGYVKRLPGDVSNALLGNPDPAYVDKILGWAAFGGRFYVRRAESRRGWPSSGHVIFNLDSHLPMASCIIDALGVAGGKSLPAYGLRIAPESQPTILSTGPAR